MKKKLLLSSLIVFGSIMIVSAQTGKNIKGSKAQNNISAPTQSATKAVATTKQPKTELEQKEAIKKEQALKAASKAKPKAAMSLVEAKQ